jgi:hypothetical protein
MLLRFGLVLALVVGSALSTIAPSPVAAKASAEEKAEAKKAAEIRRAARRIRPTITAQPLMTPPLPERKTAKAAPVPPIPDTWSEDELKAAKARCAAVLKKVDADLTYEAPIKEGLCGTPAPIRLSRLGKVTFKPAALINCGLLQPLDTWINKDVQPAAQRELGSRVTKIEVMSDYSCRTAFGRVGRKLSQHAYVDALDIRGFVTESGKTVSVLDGWGATKRDIVVAARAREKAEAEKRAAEQAADNQSGEEVATNFGTMTTRSADGSGSPPAPPVKKSHAAANAARLGGPEGPLPPRKKAAAVTKKEAAKVATVAPSAVGLPAVGADGEFLREAHAAACRIFGTTLGPEANEAHRNHFHVDMAQRRIRNICD